MTDYRRLRSEVFVLRFWQEASSGTWRGQAVRLSGGETFWFASWDQARAFVSRFVTGLEEDSLPAQPVE